MAGGLGQGTRGWLSPSGGAPIPAITGTTTSGSNTVLLTWSENVTLTATGALSASYTVTPPIGFGAVTVTAVTYIGPNQISLTTTDQSSGADYTLTVASGVVEGVGSTLNSTQVVYFTGNNAPLTVTSSRYVDTNDVIINFSRAVIQATATIPENYVFSPSLTVNQVVVLTPAQVDLKTSDMQPNTTYTVTVSNVQALDGSYI